MFMSCYGAMDDFIIFSHLKFAPSNYLIHWNFCVKAHCWKLIKNKRKKAEMMRFAFHVRLNWLNVWPELV